MPADLRISQLVIDPPQPEAAAPFHFWVECANVGDEGTDPFGVRFELDQTESIELPVQNVAPQDSQWVSWPHDGMSVGDHFIYCLLDPDHAVTDGSNQQSLSIYFKVKEIEFAPQAAGGDTNFDEQALANAVISVISDRVNLWMTLAVQAVDEWGTEATGHVQAKYQDAEAMVDAGPVILGFEKAVLQLVPGASTALEIFEDIYNLGQLVRSNMGQLTMAGARAKLMAAIDQLKLATGKGLRQEIDGYPDRLAARLSPDNNDNPLHQVEYGSLEPDYLLSLADWLGVPEPTEANTTTPIKQEMTDGFQVVMDDVDRQLSENQ